MTGSSFGKLLNLTTFGESHGPAIGGVLQGFPAGFHVDIDQLQHFVARRKPGLGIHASTRKEADEITLLSGLMDGKSLGTPIAFMVANSDAKPKDYTALKDVYRPSHADYTWQQKYGIRDYRGGGRSSARETVARVIAGGLALQFLQAHGVSIVASVISLGEVQSKLPQEVPTSGEVDAHPLRCVDQQACKDMERLLQKTKAEGDTLGGVIHCWIKGLPAGLGEPVFDKMQARLAAAMLSINAAKAFEYGEGFNAARMKGSKHNDRFISEDEQIKTESNRAGGILGGISNGECVHFSTSFKPIASIKKSNKNQ
jgi:chorismate synthase